MKGVLAREMTRMASFSRISTESVLIQRMVRLRVSIQVKLAHVIAEW